MRERASVRLGRSVGQSLARSGRAGETVGRAMNEGMYRQLIHVRRSHNSTHSATRHLGSGPN